MSTLAIWCRVVQSRDVRSRVFSRPENWSIFDEDIRPTKMCQFLGYPVFDYENADRTKATETKLLQAAVKAGILHRILTFY